MLSLTCVLAAFTSASAFSVGAGATRPPTRALTQMRFDSLGYQTEAAGSARIVQEMGLADEISLLRAAVLRASAEKDLDAQRTLIMQCRKVQHRLKANMKALQEQVRCSPQRAQRCMPWQCPTMAHAQEVALDGPRRCPTVSHQHTLFSPDDFRRPR
eukprot:scaffold99988_cov41-Tisochrysis_lutea.AAC.1